MLHLKPIKIFIKQRLTCSIQPSNYTPDFANAYYDRGIAKTELGDYKAAIEDFDKVIELYPDHVGAYYNRGKHEE